MVRRSEREWELVVEKLIPKEGILHCPEING
jgi:hypothetical protein